MPNQLLAILSLLAHSERPLQMKEIRSQLDIPRSSAFRLVEELLAEGWLVARGSPRRYAASWKTADLGLATVYYHPHRNLLFPQLVGLAEEAGLPAHLAFCEDGWTYFVDLVEVLGGRVLHRYGAMPLQALGSGAGRAILAHRPPEELEELLARGVIKRTELTKTDPEELRAEVARARKLGYGVASNESVIGSIGIASPVFGEHGEPVAALGLHGLDNAQIEAAAPILMKWARRASTLVGAKSDAHVA